MKIRDSAKRFVRKGSLTLVLGDLTPFGIVRDERGQVVEAYFADSEAEVILVQRYSANGSRKPDRVLANIIPEDDYASITKTQAILVQGGYRPR